MRCCWLLALVGCGRLSFDPITGDGSQRDAPSGMLRSAYLKASNTSAFDFFGWSIAVSGDGSTLVVGAPAEDSSASGINGNQSDGSLANAGAVYVFVRSGATWIQEAYLKASNPGMDDNFGTVVALANDGNTLVVTALAEDSASAGINSVPDEGATDAGAAYVFVRSGSTWTQQAYLKASNPNAVDGFGTSAAISASGDTLAIGAMSEASAATGIDGNQLDNGAGASGAVYVFTRSGATWKQAAYVKASNTEAGDQFGAAVALSADGNLLAVAAIGEDSGTATNQADNSTTQAGAIYVFAHGTSWMQQAYVKASLPAFGDYFGDKVALSAAGDVLLAAVPGEDTVVPNSGAASLFTRSGNTWSHAQLLKASNAGNDDQFGSGIALAGTGSVVMISAPNEDSSASGFDGNQLDDSLSDSGACYVYDRAGNAWTQQTYAKANVPGPGDQLGWAVAMSSDARTLAASTIYEDSAATGVDGDPTDNSSDSSGAVIVTFY